MRPRFVANPDKILTEVRIVLRILAPVEPHPTIARFVHPLLPERKLGRGPRPIALDGRDYVLFRDGSGRPGAIVDQCAHRKAPLRHGRVMGDGRLQCTYHGWSFDLDGQGRSPSQPELTRCDVAALRVERRFGYLWGHAPNAAVRFPLETPVGARFLGAFAQRCAAPLHVVLDNFSEHEHVPWVHARFGWSARAADTIEFSTQSFDDRTEVHYAGVQRDSRVLRPFGVVAGDRFCVDSVTRFDPLRVDSVHSWRDTRGKQRPVTAYTTVFMTPESTKSTRLDVFSFLRVDDEGLARWERLLGWGALAMAWLEIRDDRRVVNRLAETPTSFDGMRLGKFDKPLVQNRRLLERNYLGAHGDARLSVVK